MLLPYKPAKNEDEEEKLQKNENEMKLEIVPNVELSLLAKPRFRAVSTTPRRRTFILQSTPRLEISFGVNEHRWLIANVRDLVTNRMLMEDQAVVRLL